MAPENTPLPTEIALSDETSGAPPCVLVFNANDPSGAGGLSADVLAAGSVGAHALPVVTGAYMRDTAEIFDHIAFDDDAVAEQARSVLEDMSVQIIKVGFCGTPDNLSAIAEISTDYAEVPVIAYMPNLSWWEDEKIDAYLDAFRELILPQTTVLVGNHNTLWRWLLPDWSNEKSPSPRDIARAAAEVGVPYVLVTGINHPDQHVENALATAHTVMVSERFERFDAVFSGAGDTLSVTLAAVLDRHIPPFRAFGYIIASTLGAIVGTVFANVSFGLTAIQLSTNERATVGTFSAEVFATAALVLIIQLLGARRQSNLAPLVIGGWITSAIYFTSSTSFANPAVTIARMLTDTMTGINPISALMFVGAQLIGLPIGFMLIIVLLVVSAVRRGRAAKDASN